MILGQEAVGEARFPERGLKIVGVMQLIGIAESDGGLDAPAAHRRLAPEAGLRLVFTLRAGSYSASITTGDRPVAVMRISGCEAGCPTMARVCSALTSRPGSIP